MGWNFDVTRSVASELARRPKAWRITYSDVNRLELFRAWLKLLLVDNRAGVREGYSLSGVSRFAGLMTYRYASLYWLDPARLFGRGTPRTMDELCAIDRRENVLGHTLRLEWMDSDIAALFRLLGENPIAEPSTRVNISSHAPTASYYDEEARELVRTRESLIIEKYGYSVPCEVI
jgi:hypothetical protein